LGAAILVVDDDRDNATSLELLLKAAGYSVAAVNDGASALALARQDPPRLVFIDLAMPGMDGFALAQRLRALPGMGAARLVCLTGYSGVDFRRRAIDAGCNEYLIKPGSPEEILQLAREAVASKAHRETLSKQEEAPAAPPAG
jgi:CheY-like chemotaxis protein